MSAHVPTLLLVNILITATLALCLGLVARRGRGDGLFHWGLGLSAHSLAYVLILLRGQADAWISMVLANVLLLSGMALVQEGLYQFLQRPVPRLRIWLPVALAAVAFGLLRERMEARVVLLALLILAQLLQIVRAMLQDWDRTPGRGKAFVLAGLALPGLGLALRAGVTLGGGMNVQSMVDPHPLQTLTFGLVAVSMMLASFGYVIMVKERADARNHELAFTDALTGLHNRRHMQQALAQHLALTRRTAMPLSLLLLDMDHFKHINDRHGHLEGDRVLRAIAQCLRGWLRTQDIAGRWGGEEFIALLPATDAAGARALAERLRTAVQDCTFTTADGQRLPLSVSIGGHTLEPGNPAGIDSLIGTADRALYQAKNDGRNRVEFGSPIDATILVATNACQVSV
ncbi:diguanylate cyclase [Alicycliphilus denitrificans]|uniref:GGDEF domain-containing protein n=1 Tax=Alicycliphilus denitrificans TaxID=179636 RepID=UPI00384D8DE8